MKRVIVDPVTRIEGHLRLEVEVDEGTGKVKDALSSGTAWRGIETVVKNRDPRDAWAFVQRICGVCTSAHALVAVRAVEDALGIKIPKNAHYVRNIMAGAILVHDHIVHFYHLHALDWVSPIEALKANPVATASLQNAVLDNYTIPVKGPDGFDFSAYPKVSPKGTAAYYKNIQSKIKELVDTNQLGIFAANWWDHPAYKILPPEVHLMGIAHYLEMLDKQREIVTPHVVFGGKNPHPHYVVGGMSCAISMNEMNAPINSQRLARVEKAIDSTINMTNQFYVPDVMAIAHIHAQHGSALDGGGLSKVRVLGFGSYPDEPFVSHRDFASAALVRCDGVVENFAQGIDNAAYIPLTGKDLEDSVVITESAKHAWYKDNEALHPWKGKTNPDYTGDKNGSKEKWDELDKDKKYSWIKTPKWRGKVCEVGPLARYIIVYTKIKKGIIKPTWAEQIMMDQIAKVSNVLNLSPEKWLPSTAGRTMARALDAQLAAIMEKYFFDKLVKNIGTGDTNIANTLKWDPSSWTDGEFKGVGLFEAPRGALSHWIVIKNKKVKNYQAVVPTTWNACPRDDKAGNGAYEMSMIDTQLQIPDKPLEIVRAIRSFDPCLACAAHVYDSKKKTLSMVDTDPYIGGSGKA
ncbi:nickel-dependent hydrogenase large subunit [Pectinatus sottacetonis]|uniref:nickel-dependent hydrogenase large subunit n=1 Tax=Pectinatus sottacetonis TaxID=1002795 RepID=UPI0018C7F26F|nr:nickel-dependent hydrogenase large subunit [Pectinatus sottacetonis]